jgi:hypothetical protein
MLISAVLLIDAHLESHHLKIDYFPQKLCIVNLNKYTSSK